MGYFSIKQTHEESWPVELPFGFCPLKNTVICLAVLRAYHFSEIKILHLDAIFCQMLWKYLRTDSWFPCHYSRTYKKYVLWTEAGPFRNRQVWSQTALVKLNSCPWKIWTLLAMFQIFLHMYWEQRNWAKSCKFLSLPRIAFCLSGYFSLVFIFKTWKLTEETRSKRRWKK